MYRHNIHEDVVNATWLHSIAARDNAPYHPIITAKKPPSEKEDEWRVPKRQFIQPYALFSDGRWHTNEKQTTVLYGRIRCSRVVAESPFGSELHA
jgi:hypothetical protein